MADTPPPIGTRAQHANGSIVMWDGHNWVQTTAAVRGGGRSGSDGMSPQDRTQIGTMRTDAEAANQMERTFSRVANANQRLQPGPWRGSFLDAAIPSEDDGLLGRIGGVTLGPIARAIGAITPHEVDDYQTLQRARNQAVLAQQLSQRGVQTESDAARMALASINVHNMPEQNQQVIDQGTQDAIRQQARTTFYTTWASRYGGLNKPNEQGATVDQVWTAHQPHIIGQYMQMRGVGAAGQRAAPPPVIRRVR